MQTCQARVVGGCRMIIFYLVKKAKELSTWFIDDHFRSACSKHIFAVETFQVFKLRIPDTLGDLVRTLRAGIDEK